MNPNISTSRQDSALTTQNQQVASTVTEKISPKLSPEQAKVQDLTSKTALAALGDIPPSEEKPLSFKATENTNSKAVNTLGLSVLGSSQSSQAAPSSNETNLQERSQNLALINNGPTKLMQKDNQMKKMQAEFREVSLAASNPDSKTNRATMIQNLKTESKMLISLVAKCNQSNDKAGASEANQRLKQVAVRLNFLENPNNAESKKNFLAHLKQTQGEVTALASQLAKAHAKEGVLPSATLSDPIVKKAMIQEMGKAHIELLKADPGHIDKARDFFLATASLPPPPDSPEGLSYPQNDALIKSMASKIRSDDFPGGVEKMGGGSGGVYKLSAKNQEGAMEPFFVFKIEDEEPGGAFCRAGFEAGTEDENFPSDEGLIREEFVNRSPLDPRHVTRHTLPHHNQFNSKEGVAMPPREGVIIPFVKGGKVLEDIGVAKLETAISGARRGANATPQEIADSKAKIAALEAEIAERKASNSAENYGVDESQVPSKWGIWDKVSQESGQLVMTKVCAYGNTDANDGNIMVIGASKPGERGVLHDFDYGRAVPQGATDDYGLVTFARSSFAKAPILPAVKTKINSLDIDKEVSRMKSTWTSRKPGMDNKALDKQEEALRAHLNLLKTAVDAKEGYTLADVYTVLNSGRLSEALEAASSETTTSGKWEAFNKHLLQNQLPSAKEENS